MKKILILLLLVSPFSLAQKLEPGLWKTKSTLVLNGLPLPAAEGEECITADQTKDVKETITGELKKSSCSLDNWKLKGQKLEASLSCQKDQLNAKGRITGKVTAKSYDLSGDAEGTYNVIPSKATVTLAGEWVKNCPK